MNHDIIRILQDIFGYFAELEFESTSHDAFADAATAVLREEGFEVELRARDGELDVCNA